MPLPSTFKWEDHTSPLDLYELVKRLMVPTSACLLFIGMIKHHDQKQDGAQRIYFIYILQSQTIIKRSQGKNWIRDHRGTVNWPALSSSTNSQPIGLWSNRKYSPSGTKLCPSLLSLAVIRLWPNAARTAQLFIHSNHWKKSEKRTWKQELKQKTMLFCGLFTLLFRRNKFKPLGVAPLQVGPSHINHKPRNYHNRNGYRPI